MTFREWISQPLVWGKQGAAAALPAVKHPVAWAGAISLVSVLAGALGVGYLPQKPPSIDLPDAVNVPLDGLYTFTPVVRGGEVEWELHDLDVQGVQTPGSNALVAHFPKAGVKHIDARVALGSQIARKRIAVTVGDVPPGPGPGPNPPVPPVPPPDPAPIPDAGFRVLILLNDADIGKLPAAQQVALTATEVRQYLDSKCVLGPDGKTHEWRMWDTSVDPANESPVWQAAFKRPHASLPWIIISDGKTGFEGPLPADATSLLALLKKYGG